MKKTRALALLYLLFLLMLSLSGSTSGVLSEAVYFLSFLLPTALGIYLLKREGEGERASLLSLDTRSLRLLLPTAAPIILLIILTSSLTSFIIYLVFGAENNVNLGDNLPLALLTHAVLPAILEEMLFRYLPLRLYGLKSGATMLLVSSLFFALVHSDFFVIPYAFLAGALFMIIDIIAESVWPSVILHVLNNALSVLWIFYSHNAEFAYAFYALIIIFAVLSLCFIVKRRGEYKAEIQRIFVGERVKLDYEILYLAVPTLLLAVLDLMAKI